MHSLLPSLLYLHNAELEIQQCSRKYSFEFVFSSFDVSNKASGYLTDLMSDLIHLWCNTLILQSQRHIAVTAA